jgi:predicted DNA binding CopG/RHH family protein
VNRALDMSEPVDDFLPPPDQLIRRSAKKRITIAINSDTLASYKAFAKANSSNYQVLMDNALDAYAKTNFN